MTKISNQYSLTNVLTADPVNGRVGIGTETPGNKLVISQPVSTTFGNAGTYIGLGGTENALGQTVLLGFGYRGSSTSEYPAVMGYLATNNGGNQSGALVFGTRDVTTNTAPTERMRITSAGNVGIGTTSPVWLLEINKDTTSGSAGGYPAISVNNPNAAGYTGYYFYSGTTQKGGIEYSNSSNAFSFYNLGSERMRITSAGNVGIGASISPTYLLEVSTAGGSQRIRVGTLQNNNNSATFEAITTSTNTTASAAFFRANAGGSATIGVTTYSKSGGDSGNFANLSNQANTVAIQITGAGDVCVATETPVFESAGRGCITIGGSSTSILSLKPGGNAGGYLYHNGSSLSLNNNLAGGVYVTASSGGVQLNNGATSWTSSSDERLKNIKSNIEDAVSKLSSLRAVNFSWKSDETQKEVLGLIAQDVEKVFPQVVDKGKLPSNIDEEQIDKTEYLGVRYTELVPVLVKAIQELSAQASEQQLQINELKALLNA